MPILSLKCTHCEVFFSNIECIFIGWSHWIYFDATYDTFQQIVSRKVDVIWNLIRCFVFAFKQKNIWTHIMFPFTPFKQPATNTEHPSVFVYSSDETSTPWSTLCLSHDSSFAARASQHPPLNTSPSQTPSSSQNPPDWHQSCCLWGFARFILPAMSGHSMSMYSIWNVFFFCRRHCRSRCVYQLEHTFTVAWNND